MIDSVIWDEISLEVLIAARAGLAVKDFEIQCRLAPMENGKTFFDRIRVAESLIRDRLITSEDGYLRLSNKVIPESLIQNLKTGSVIAWKILDCIDPPQKTFQKIDQELLSQIGLEGELAVIRELNRNLSSEEIHRIKHISLVDDSVGYDIQAPSFRNIDANLLLEVKTSVRPGDNFHFYISKNEARVAQQNSNWFLVGVESTPYGYQLLGGLTFNTFADFLPVNQSPNGQWESAKIVIPKKIFTAGLP
jgi:hypothetical protein